MSAPHSIAARLTAHLAGDGTPNDSTTDALYREALRIPAGEETNLEDVEQWAFHHVRTRGDLRALASATWEDAS